MRAPPKVGWIINFLHLSTKPTSFTGHHLHNQQFTDDVRWNIAGQCVSAVTSIHLCNPCSQLQCFLLSFPSFFFNLAQQHNLNWSSKPPFWQTYSMFWCQSLSAPTEAKALITHWERKLGTLSFNSLSHHCSFKLSKSLILSNIASSRAHLFLLCL